jgi:hypothetical protein
VNRESTPTRFFVPTVEDLQQATLAVRLDPAGLPAGSPSPVLLVHLAEHLLGRALLAEPWLYRLRGTARGVDLQVRFVAPRAPLDEALHAGTFDRLVTLRDLSLADLAEELAVLAVEDTVLPAAVHTRGRLPTDPAQIRGAWAAGTPRVRLDRGPFPSPALREALSRPGGKPASQRRRRGSGAAQAARERTPAYAGLLRRLGRRPELFVDGEPFTDYYRPTAVLLSGLSGYRSPLFHQFRRWGCYSVRLFDFGWRRHTFTAVTTVPGVGPEVFGRDLGPRTVAALRDLTRADLEGVLVDGVLEALEDLEALMADSHRCARVARLAEENGFPDEPGAMARSLLHYTQLDGCVLRDVVVDRFTGRLSREGAW